MIQQNQRYRRFFIPCLSEPGAYITHNATLPQSDIIGGNLSDHILLCQEPQKSLYSPFFSHMQ